jgi:hypothetical protein
MHVVRWLREWYARHQAQGRADEQRYQEELEGDARQLLADEIGALHDEIQQLDDLLESDYYSLGIPLEFSGEKDNPWADPSQRIQRNNQHFQTYANIRNNERHFRQRAGDHLMVSYFEAYQVFSKKREDVITREQELQKERE